MEYLPQQNRRNLGDTVAPETEIVATGKRVIIIGGGDTGADCLGTCHRQKPLSVHQFEIMPKPPDERSPQTPWPFWPMQLRTEGAHEEGGIRDWSIATTRFTGSKDGHVQLLHAIRVGAPPKFDPIADSYFRMEVDLVLIAMGFMGPVRNGMIEQCGVKLDSRGNIATDHNYMSSVPGVFAAGDMRCGPVADSVGHFRRPLKATAGVDTYLRAQALPSITTESTSALQTTTNRFLIACRKQQLPRCYFAEAGVPASRAVAPSSLLTPALPIRSALLHPRAPSPRARSRRPPPNIFSAQFPPVPREQSSPRNPNKHRERRANACTKGAAEDPHHWSDAARSRLALDSARPASPPSRRLPNLPAPAPMPFDSAWRCGSESPPNSASEQNSNVEEPPRATARPSDAVDQTSP